MLLKVLCGVNSQLNESNEGLKMRMKQWCLYFHSSFPFFQDHAIIAEINLELLLHLRVYLFIIFSHCYIDSLLCKDIMVISEQFFIVFTPSFKVIHRRGAVERTIVLP